MGIFVDGQEIKQIVIDGAYISKVFYGGKIVFECNKLFESNMPVRETVWLTPGVYEIIAVGGGGGSGAQGSGGDSGSGAGEGNTAYAIGGS